MDSMTEAELNCKQKIDDSRAKRIARGSGCALIEVKILLDEYKRFSKIVGKMGGLVKGKGGELAQIQRNPNQFMNKLNGMLPQNLINQMGGTGGIMNMMKEFSNMEGLQNLAGLKRKMKNLEVKTKKLEKINNIFYEMIQKQNLEIDTQNNKYELEKLNNRFLLRNQEPRPFNNSINTNLPLLQSHNMNNNMLSYYNDQPYRYNYQPLQLPYINEMERILSNIKLENEGYKKIRENENHIMRRIDEKINDFLLEETLKNNDNKYLRHQLQEMNDQINYRLESIEQNQKAQKQKLDYIMKNYFRNEKYFLKKLSKISEDENDDRSKNFNGKTNLNKSGMDIHPKYYKLKEDSRYENKSSKKNRPAADRQNPAAGLLRNVFNTLFHRISAVDWYRDPGDVRRFVAREEDRGPDDLLDVHPPAHRGQVFDLLPSLIVVVALVGEPC